MVSNRLSMFSYSYGIFLSTVAKKRKVIEIMDVCMRLIKIPAVFYTRLECDAFY